MVLPTGGRNPGIPGQSRNELTDRILGAETNILSLSLEQIVQDGKLGDLEDAVASIPTVVANALADAETVVNAAALAAADAVDDELSERNLLEAIDEDDFASDSDTNVPTQQSTKAYVDAGLATKADVPVGVEVAEDIAYARTFSDGRRTFVEFDSTGRPTSWAATLIDEALDAAGLGGAPQGVEVAEDIAYARTFQGGTRTFMEFNAEGAPTNWSAQLIVEALERYGVDLDASFRIPTVGMTPIRMAILGDSMASGASANAREAWGWANLLSHGALVRCGNGWSAGIGGQVTSEILDRVDDVTGLDPKPDICIVQGGTNDVLTGVPVEDTKANLIAIYDALEVAGIEPIACCIPPSDTQPTRVVTLNAWIASYAAYRGLRCLDNYTENAEPDGTWRSGHTGDGTHPTPLSARLMGERVVRALAPNASAEHLLAGFTSSDSTNLIVNGTFTGDTNGDGVANNWVLNTPGPHVATSLVAGTGSVIGNWQQVEKSATGNNYITPAASITTGFSEGDLMLFAGRVQLDSTDGYSIDVRVHDNGTTVDPIMFQWAGNLTSDDGAIFTHYFVVPPGTTSFSPRIIGSGSTGTGTYRIAQWTLRNLTALGAT